ncbi:MAG: hypothetical protein Terrestrivirus1_286 [Terrestrivirus sp.]|uniref:Uncharacterized protein n=1 Tax=Terrestrivirus sp. TaxID=2487775 RepID=A0A3G4ZKP9_9VIRU|nr:MAG: hypothetical protein Terrestrivirus1_286 [Terrestrivirus sp.]
MLINWINELKLSIVFNNQFFNPYQKIDGS